MGTRHAMRGSQTVLLSLREIANKASQSNNDSDTLFNIKNVGRWIDVCDAASRSGGHVMLRRVMISGSKDEVAVLAILDSTRIRAPYAYNNLADAEDVELSREDRFRVTRTGKQDALAPKQRGVTRILTLQLQPHS